MTICSIAPVEVSRVILSMLAADKFPYNMTEAHMKEETQKHVSLLSGLVKQLARTEEPEKTEPTKKRKWRVMEAGKIWRRA